MTINKRPLDAFRAHAVAEYPRECCGLVIVVRGRQRYVPIKNVASTPSEHFVMDGREQMAAEDAGEVIAVMHSHPDAAARASEADRVQCEASGLPWYIASVMRDGEEPPVVVEVANIVPEGYESPLVNRPFAHGVLDCYSLIRDWYKREAGVVLPDFERRDNWWNDGVSSLYLDHFKEAGFVELSRQPNEVLDQLQRGDIILMQIRSKNDVPNHAAVYLGDGKIIHHLYGRLSSRDVYGGEWLEASRMIVRRAAECRRREAVSH